MLCPTVAGPESSAWSPSRTLQPETYGTPVKLESHMTPAFGAREDINFTPVVPAPPSPSVGGMVGAGNRVGWSTGIRSLRYAHQLFRGATLTVPTMGVHPNIGNVGLSARQQRLDNGIDAQTAEFLPSQAVVAASFTTKGLSAVQLDMLRN